MKKLTKNELKELKGGALPPDGGGDPAIPGGRDIINTNRVNFCYCNYNDMNVIKNTNNTETCICNCVGK